MSLSERALCELPLAVVAEIPQAIGAGTSVINSGARQ
jgi:hypothetical protein